MKRREFNACIAELQADTTLGDLDASMLGLRLDAFWQEFERRPVEELAAAVKWIIRENEQRFFPTLAELLQALREATRPKYHPADCPLCDGTGWRPVKCVKGEGVVRCETK